MGTGGREPPRPSAAASPSSASARRSTTSTARRRSPSSSWRCRPSSPPARTPASTRATSTASPPTATTATIPRGWPPRSACPELRFSNMQWGGGGGGGSAAVGNAAAAIAAGLRRLRRRLPRARPGPVRPLRPGRRAARTVVGRAALTVPLRPDVAGAALRHAGACASCTSTASARRRCGRSRWPPTTTRRTTRAR